LVAAESQPSCLPCDAASRAIEVEQCRRCGGRLTVIASIEEPALIERILAHVTQRACEEQIELPFLARTAAAVAVLSRP
jgi:hypothetical protein